MLEFHRKKLEIKEENLIKIIFIAILIIFTGCVKKEVVYYQGDNSQYIPKKSSTSTSNTKTYTQYKKIKKNTTQNQKAGCETEITEIYNSKESGKITICKGKILTVGKKTKFIYVNK